MLKKHLAGENKTAEKMNLPVCGKVSSAIEFDTLSKEDFNKTPIVQRCKNCERLNN